MNDKTKKTYEKVMAENDASDKKEVAKEKAKKEVKVLTFAQLSDSVKVGDIIKVYHEKEQKSKMVQFVHKLNDKRLACVNRPNGVVWDIQKHLCDDGVLTQMVIVKNEKCRAYDKGQCDKHFKRFPLDIPLYGGMIKAMGITIKAEEEKPKA